MSDFEFVFSLFGLLLGLSLAELLGGFGRVVDAELGSRRTGAREFRAGWLTPLLGLFTLIDITTFWMAAWGARAQLSVTGAVMLGGLFFAGSYYLAATLVFPREPREWPDLDGYFFAVRRAVVGALLALAWVQLAFVLRQPGMWERLKTPGPALSIASFNVLLIALLLVRGKRAATVLLSVLIVRYLYYFFLA